MAGMQSSDFRIVPSEPRPAGSWRSPSSSVVCGRFARRLAIQAIPKKYSNRMQRWAADDLVQIATQLRALVDPLKIDRGRRDSRDEYWRSKYKSMAARA